MNSGAFVAMTAFAEAKVGSGSNVTCNDLLWGSFMNFRRLLANVPKPAAYAFQPQGIKLCTYSLAQS